MFQPVHHRYSGMSPVNYHLRQLICRLFIVISDRWAFPICITVTVYNRYSAVLYNMTDFPVMHTDTIWFHHLPCSEEHWSRDQYHPDTPRYLQNVIDFAVIVNCTKIVLYFFLCNFIYAINDIGSVLLISSTMIPINLLFILAQTLRQHIWNDTLSPVWFFPLWYGFFHWPPQSD